MTFHRIPFGVALPLVAALSGYACEENNARTTIIGPSNARSNVPNMANVASGARFVSRAVSIEAAPVTLLAFPDAACPAIPSFVAPLNLMVRANSASALSLSQVQMQFVDNSGFGRISRTVTRVDLATLFGSTLIPAFGTRTFPFSFPLGCVGSPFGTLTIVVFAADPLGHESTMSLQIAVG
jgi:hypothetical protein